MSAEPNSNSNPNSESNVPQTPPPAPESAAASPADTQVQTPCLEETKLLLLARGVLSKEARAGADAHLDGCAKCRSLLAAALKRGPSPSSESPDATATVATVAAADSGKGERTVLAGIPSLMRSPLSSSPATGHAASVAAPGSALAALNALTSIGHNPLENGAKLRALLPYEPPRIPKTPIAELLSASGLGGSPSLSASGVKAPKILSATEAVDDTTVGSNPAASVTGAWKGTLTRGDVVARYVVVDWLGEGAMSEVYVGYDPSLQRRVALKIVHPPLDPVDGVSPSESRQRLLVEAQVLARISHPNIVTVHDAGEIGDGVFLALELVDGVTLRQWCAQTPRGWRPIAERFLAAAQGLVSAHAAGVIHRDFKPDNVLVENGKTGPDGVRVADFGVARNVSAGDVEVAASALAAGPSVASKSLTHRGAVIGTPAYMAPAQLAGTPADVASDQFSFCVSFFEMLTGNLPSEMGFAVAPLPKWLKSLLRRGLSTDAAMRFPSMAALAAELERRLKVRTRLWLAGGGAAAAAVLAAVIGFQAASGSKACGDGAHHLAGVWDAARSQSLQGHFAKFAGPIVQLNGDKTRALLDEYAQAWKDQRKAACEATNLHHEQSDEALDARMRCLDERLGAFASLTTALVSVDEKSLARAPDAVRKLPALESCQDGRALLLTTEPEPKDETHRQSRAALRKELADAASLVDLGKNPEATKQLDGLHSRVEADGSNALAARYFQLRAGIAYSSNRFDDARDATLKSALAAVKSNGFATGAKMFGKLAWLSVHGTPTPSVSAAEGWNALAEATRLRIPESDPERLMVEGILARDQAIVFGSLGNATESEKAFRRAQDLGKRSELLGPQFLGGVQSSLGVVVLRQGRLDEGLALIRDAVQLNIAVDGENHPMTGSIYVQYAQACLEAARYDEGLTAARSAVKILSQFNPDDSGVMGNARLYEADALVQLGRGKQAVPVMEKALPALKKAYPANHPTVAYALIVEGETRLAAGTPQQARRALDPAYDLLVSQKTGLGARMRWVLAQVLVKQGRVKQARVLAKQAQYGFSKGQGLYGPNPKLDAFLKKSPPSSARRGARRHR